MSVRRLAALALRALGRDWRAGELRVLAAALVIAAAAVASVGFFADRIRVVMERQAGELMAADLVLESRRPIPAILAAGARDHGLATARTLTFPSVVVAGEATAFSEIKAVTEGYPLRGALETRDRPFGQAAVTSGVPEPGTVWLDDRLAQVLRVDPGAAVGVGASGLAFARVLSHEPDRGGDLFSIAPRLMMNAADVGATGLLGPGSRVRYRLLVAGSLDALAAFRPWVEARLPSDVRLQGVREARPELRVALDRGQRFLGLAALVSVILAGVAVAIAARRFAARRWDHVAIMRCFGATEATVLGLFGLEMLVLALFASLAGAAAGYAAQEVLARLLGGIAGGGLPAPTLRPAIPALAVGMITWLGFGLPPLVRLRRVPPLRVLRRDLGPVTAGSAGLYLPGCLAVLALLLWQAADLRLAAYASGGTAGAALVLGLAAWGLVRLLARLRGRVGVAWRFGLANVSRRGAASAAQVVALGLGIMVLLVLALVRNDLLDGWRDSLPEDAPNHFLINIQGTEVEAVQALLDPLVPSRPRLHPMVKGRVVRLNGQPIPPERYRGEREQRVPRRELNLSWADQLQEDNRVLAGRWWRPEDRGRAVISVEEGLARRLGVATGDTIGFDIAGEPLAAEVQSLRSVEWESFRANFFVLFPPGTLEGYPATWISAFYLPPADKPALAELVRAFPSVTILDVDALMQKVREIMDRVSLAVEYVFAFTVLAGLVVLFAAIQATRDERLYEAAMLRTLGAQRPVIVKSLVAEFAALGLLAGLLASLAAALIGYVLAVHVFQIDHRMHPLIWLVGPVAGTAGVTLAGWLGARGTIERPPMAALRAE